MTTKIKAVYAGSFDPITLGHEDVIRRAIRMFDELVIGVGINSSKQSLFSPEERINMIAESLSALISATHNYRGDGFVGDPRITIKSFDGLLTEFCKQEDAQVIVRGVRAVTDFEYELTISHANFQMAPVIDTIFFPTRLGYSAVSSSVVKEIARYKGDISAYVSKPVEGAMKKKLEDHQLRPRPPVPPPVGPGRTRMKPPPTPPVRPGRTK